MTLLHLLLLGIQFPRQLGVARELPRIVVESREVCITHLFVGIDSEHRVGLGGNLGGLGLKETPTLCEHLNRDVGNLCGWLNFRNKSCVSLYILLFTFCCLFVFFVFLCSRPRVLYSSLF
jgi:hypothetical protein